MGKTNWARAMVWPAGSAGSARAVVSRRLRWYSRRGWRVGQPEAPAEATSASSSRVLWPRGGTVSGASSAPAHAGSPSCRSSQWRRTCAHACHGLSHAHDRVHLDAHARGASSSSQWRLHLQGGEELLGGQHERGGGQRGGEGGERDAQRRVDVRHLRGVRVGPPVGLHEAVRAEDAVGPAARTVQRGLSVVHGGLDARGSVHTLCVCVALRRTACPPARSRRRTPTSAARRSCASRCPGPSSPI